MTDTGIAAPEPTELDETRQRELRILSEDAVLKGHPHGDELCKNCLYYLDAHLVFTACGQVQDTYVQLDAGALADLTEKTSFILAGYDVQLHGRCARCAAQDNSKDTAQ